MKKANGLKTLITAGLIFGTSVVSQAQTWFEGIYNNKPGIENSRNRVRINAKKIISFKDGQNLAFYGFSEIYKNGSFSRFLPTYNFASLGKDKNQKIGLTLNTKHIHMGKKNADFAAIGFAYTYLNKDKNLFVSAKALAPAYHLQEKGFKSGDKPTGIVLGVVASKGWETSIGDLTLSAFGEADVSNMIWGYGEARLSYTPQVKGKNLPISIQVGTDMISNPKTATLVPKFDMMTGVTYSIGK